MTLYCQLFILFFITLSFKHVGNQDETSQGYDLLIVTGIAFEATVYDAFLRWLSNIYQVKKWVQLSCV